MTLRLHYAPDNASLCVRRALALADAPFQAAAILFWLAGRYPEAGLKLDGPGMGRLAWMSNALDPALRMIFYPDSRPPTDGLSEAGAARATALFDFAEARLPGTPLLDCCLCPMLRWTVLYPAGSGRWFHLDSWPRLAARGRNVKESPAAACNAEGLGPTPFTAPRQPQPPEGSAT